MKRKLLVAGPIALLVVIGVVAFIAWPRGGTAVTEDEAVERFRSAESTTTITAGGDTTDDAGDATDAPTAPPKAGVYSFTTTGGESVKLGPLPAETRDYPATVPVTVTAGTDRGCFTVRLDLLAEHSEDTTYCATDEGGLRLAGHEKRQVVGPMKPVATMTCEDDLLVDPAADEGALACSLSIDGGPAKLNATVSGTVNTTASTLDVAGESVDVVVVAVTYALSGDLTGSWTETTSLSLETWLPLQIERKLDMEGLATFSETSTLTIQSLDPAT